MSWDTTACFKALCTAYSDFQHQPSEQTVQDLQRQIDVILGVTRHGATLKDFTPKQLIYAESLSALVGVINEPNLKTSLYLKSLMAISQLSNDLETKASLQGVFNLSSSLAGFILSHATTTNKQMILQGLLLLQKITYGSSCDIPNIYMVDLLRYLVKATYTPSDYCMPSLAILANLCRNGVNVQKYIKSMDDVKPFCKILLNYLSHSNKSYSITSLSILTCLYLNEDVGEKVFNGQNLTNIIRLVFTVLIGNDDLVIRQYSIDLIIDFIKCSRILNTINQNEMFKTYIYQILNLLHSTDANTSTKIFELLIGFCHQPCSCKKVVEVFIKNSLADEQTQLPNQLELSPAQAVLHWITHSEKDDMVMQANLLSMVFLKELVIEATTSGMLNQISVYIIQILPVLFSYLNLDINTDDAKQVKYRFRKVTSVLELLLSLCKVDGMKDIIVEQIDFKILFHLIGSTFEKFSEDLKTLRNPALQCSNEIVFLVFRALELISILKHSFDSGPAQYTSLIQSPKLIPLLSVGLTSNSKFLVHASLQIFAEGLKVKEFQTKCLGDTLTSHNTSRLKELTSLQDNHPDGLFNYSQPMQLPPTQPLSDISSRKGNLSRESASIAFLTERIKNGLDIKDSKLSDIMDFYEHKLAALTGRESHMQDLLEAKTVTLAQTDRLLAQYRCRHAQSEAECLKLRSMLQSAERKCETDTITLSEYLKTKRNLDEQINSQQDQLKVLESVATEHEELRKMFQEQNQKLESVQKSLIAAEEEHQSLTAMNECLMKNGEKLKAKLDCANERLKLMEEEQINLVEQIKEKENKISEFKKSMEHLKELLSQKQQENEELGKTGKELEKVIKNLEKVLKDSKVQIGSLEIRCSEQEQTIKEKDDAISQLYVELEKQSQISAMIHNLTSGKINVAK